MQRNAVLGQLKRHAFLAALAWLALSFASPARIANFDFRHFIPEESLTISFSKSSPPLAVLEDEKLGVVAAEPLQSLHVDRGMKIIEAGARAVWPKIAKRVIAGQVEQSLNSPRVERSLPRGEEAPPIVIEEDHISRGEASQIEGGGLAVYVPTAEVGPSEAATPETIQNLVYVKNPLPQAPSPAVSQHQSESQTLNAVRPANQGPAPQQTIADNKRLNGVSEAAKEILGQMGQPRGLDQGTETTQFKILGSVELAGGLALTDHSKLTIQWKTGMDVRDGVIDYPTATFMINPVPTLTVGKIIATLYEDDVVMGHGEFDMDGAAGPAQSVLDDVRLIVEPIETLIKGRVLSAYSVGDVIVPVAGAELFGPAQTRDLTDKSGNFRLPGLSSTSTFIMEAYAPDHWGTRVVSSGSRRLTVPVFPNKMMDSFLNLVNEPTGNADFGVVWGEIRHRGKTVSGVQVALSTHEAIGPIYFNELRIPDKNLKETSSNGLFAFIKVRPGLHVVSSAFNGHELPSSVAAVSPGMVSYTSVAFKRLQIRGRVFDPVAQSPINAVVSVVGSSRTTKAGPEGFELKVPSSDAVVFVEASAGSRYFVSRAAISRPEAQSLDLYAFRKAWVAEKLVAVGTKLDETKGLLIGEVRGPNFTVHLDELSDPKAADTVELNTHYFNAKGDLDSQRVDGLAGRGAFMITNLSPGLHTLVITSADGQMTTTRIVVSEAGVVNVIKVSLRP